MFAQIEKTAKKLGQGARQARKGVQAAKRYLRVELPIQGVGKASAMLESVLGHAKLVHHRMVVNHMCSSNVTTGELEGLWDLDFPDLFQGAPNVKDCFSYSYKEGEPPTYRGSFSRGPFTTAVVEGEPARYKNIRERARELGQQKAEALRQSQEEAKQDRLEGLVEMLSEALESNLGEDASVQDVLRQICKINLLSWEAVQEGSFNPRTPLRELLTPKPAAAESAPKVRVEVEVPGEPTVQREMTLEELHGVSPEELLAEGAKSKPKKRSRAKKQSKPKK